MDLNRYLPRVKSEGLQTAELFITHIVCLCVAAQTQPCPHGSCTRCHIDNMCVPHQLRRFPYKSLQNTHTEDWFYVPLSNVVENEYITV